MVYIDVVMILNFLVDFLLMLSANSLSGFPPGYSRVVLAAAVGGIYGGVCLLPGFGFLGSFFWRLVFLVIMAMLAFGFDRSAIRRGMLFVLLSMALGGIVVGLNSSGAVTLVAAAGALSLLCVVGFRGNLGGKKYSTVELKCDGRQRVLTALQDTGNVLRDPVTGVPVLVVGSDLAWELMGLTVGQLATPIETVLQVPGLRLIPYRSVGQPGGMLLAMKMDCVRIDGKKWDGLVAFAPQKLGHDGFEALAGGTV